MNLKAAAVLRFALTLALLTYTWAAHSWNGLMVIITLAIIKDELALRVAHRTMHSLNLLQRTMATLLETVQSR